MYASFLARIYGNREEIVCQGCLKDDILSCGTIKCEKLRKVGAREKKKTNMREFGKNVFI